MKSAAMIRGLLIASLSLSCLIAACTTDDCERETITTPNVFTVYVPKGVPAIRCHAEITTYGAGAANGKKGTWTVEFKMPDQLNDQKNTAGCADRAIEKTRIVGAEYDVSWDHLCLDPDDGGGGVPPGGDVGAGVGVGVGAAGDYILPVPSDEGAGGAPAEEGEGGGAGEDADAEPGQGEA